MMKYRLLVSALVLFGFTLSVQADNSDLDKLRKFVLRQASEHRTMTADVNIEMFLQGENGMTEAIGAGSLYLASDGKDTNVRVDVKVLYDGGPESTKGTIRQDLSVYVNSKSTAILYGGEKSPIAAQKRETNLHSVYDASTFFKQIDAKKHRVTMEKKKDRNRNKIIILTVEPSPEILKKRQSLKKNKKKANKEQEEIADTLDDLIRDDFYFNEEGVLIRHIRFDETMEPVETVKITNVKFDVPLDKNSLVFSPPAGLKVDDTTKEGLKAKELEERRKKILEKQGKAQTGQ